jgi:hypothetical protein
MHGGMTKLRFWYQDEEAVGDLVFELGLGFSKQPAWKPMEGVAGYVDLEVNGLGWPRSRMTKVIERLMAAPGFVVASCKYYYLLSDVKHRAFPQLGRYVKQGVVVEREESIPVTFWGPNPFEILALMEKLESQHAPTVEQAAAGWQRLQLFSSDSESQPGTVQVVLVGFGPKPGSLEFEIVTPEQVVREGVTINNYKIGAAGQNFVLVPAPSEPEE